MLGIPYHYESLQDGTTNSKVCGWEHTQGQILDVNSTLQTGLHIRGYFYWGGSVGKEVDGLLKREEQISELPRLFVDNF